MRHLVPLVWAFAFAGLTLPATGVLLCTHGDGCSRWSLASVHDHGAACEAHEHGDDEHRHGHDDRDHDDPADRDLVIGPLGVRVDAGFAVAVSPAPIAIVPTTARACRPGQHPDVTRPAPSRPPSAPLVLRV